MTSTWRANIEPKEKTNTFIRKSAPTYNKDSISHPDKTDERELQNKINAISNHYLHLENKRENTPLRREQDTKGRSELTLIIKKRTNVS